MKKSALIETLFDIIYSVVAGIVVACGLYFFANSNDFAPGGISGIASFIAQKFWEIRYKMYICIAMSTYNNLWYEKIIYIVFTTIVNYGL